MAQPKEPPISVRLPADLVAEVEAWASGAKKTRNGAIAELLRRGLQASGPSLPSLDVRAAMKAEAIGRRSTPKPAPKAASPSAATAATAVPWAGNFKRPPLGLKKGK